MQKNDKIKANCRQEKSKANSRHEKNSFRKGYTTGRVSKTRTQQKPLNRRSSSDQTRTETAASEEQQNIAEEAFELQDED